MAINQGKRAVSKSQSASSPTNRSSTQNPRRNQQPNPRSSPAGRKRRSRYCLRFGEARGKTVEFIEMWTDADFPCVDIGFTDKTALHFLMDTRLTMEPTYSNWTTGDQRLLRRWPAVECR